CQTLFWKSWLFEMRFPGRQAKTCNLSVIGQAFMGHTSRKLTEGRSLETQFLEVTGRKLVSS
ncbi:MAG: hypothetical protein K9N55_08040, partial [Phycisphaerae bacterium]|nr:hypothetical protein [Phycisphaerae bacterium]